MQNKKKEGTRVAPNAMAFYHDKGFVPAWKMAAKYAGKGGRIATVPDVWSARLATLKQALKMDWNYMRIPPQCPPWEQYFTTMSAEYCGLSKGGNPILIVAHGIGPMAGLDGVLKAYSHQYKDKERDIRGGLISQEEFWKLEGGEYGEVAIVDLEAYLGRYRYPFIADLDLDESLADPLLQARLGPRWRECIAAQAAISTKWHRENLEENSERLRGWGVTDPRPPKILGVSDNMNFSYWRLMPDKRRFFPDRSAMAHLLSIGGVHVIRYSGGDADLPGVVTDISCHSWYDGTRLLAVKNAAAIDGIHHGLSDLDRVIRKRWKQVAVPVEPSRAETRKHGFFRLTDDLEFAAYQEDAKTLQSDEPEFRVRGRKKVGVSVFRTRIEGYHGFFRYRPSDVRKIAPPEANAFSLGEPRIEYQDGDPAYHAVRATFYKADVDTSRRIPKEAEIMNDYDLVMDLVLSK